MTTGMKSEDTGNFTEVHYKRDSKKIANYSPGKLTVEELWFP